MRREAPWQDPKKPRGKRKGGRRRPNTSSSSSNAAQQALENVSRENLRYNKMAHKAKKSFRERIVSIVEEQRALLRKSNYMKAIQGGSKWKESTLFSKLQDFLQLQGRRAYCGDGKRRSTRRHLSSTPNDDKNSSISPRRIKTSPSAQIQLGFLMALREAVENIIAASNREESNQEEVKEEDDDDRDDDNECQKKQDTAAKHNKSESEDKKGFAVQQQQQPGNLSSPTLPLKDDGVVRVLVYDPMLSDMEYEILELDYKCQRISYRMYSNVIWANWGENISRVALIGNREVTPQTRNNISFLLSHPRHSLSAYVDKNNIAPGNGGDKHNTEKDLALPRILPYCKEVKISDSSFEVPGVFNDMSLHLFSIPEGQWKNVPVEFVAGRNSTGAAARCGSLAQRVGDARGRIGNVRMQSKLAMGSHWSSPRNWRSASLMVPCNIDRSAKEFEGVPELTSDWFVQFIVGAAGMNHGHS
eukprot:jgi/Bigna1/81257/fgenesh1_pg.79_\